MEDVLARGIVAVDVSLLSKLALVLPLMATFHRLWELEWSPPLLKPLAKLSYGIFYWHYYVFLASGRVISRLMPQNTIWAVGLQTLVVFAAVIAFLNLAKRLWPRFSPYLGVD